MSDSLGMRPITPSGLQRLLQLRIRVGDVAPVCVFGKAGIGKTEQITKLAEEEHIGYKEIRLLLYDVAEIKGIPYADKETQTTKIFPTDLFPIAERDGEKGILVLDEITSCTSSLRQAVYQLLDQKRSLGQYHLPDGWMVVALGNGPEDGGNFQGIEGAFLNRCACYRMEPNARDWVKWARKNSVNPSVIAFIEQNPDKLHTLTQEKWEETDGACLFASPRAWTLAAKMLTVYENDEILQQTLKEDEKASFVQDIVAGYVGSDVAILFGSMYCLREKMVQVIDILDGKNPELSDDYDTGLKYLLAETLQQTLAKELNTYDVIDDVPMSAMEKVVNVVNWILGLKDSRGRTSNDVIVTIATGLNSIPLFGDLFVNYDQADLEQMEFGKGHPEFCDKVMDAMSKYDAFCMDHGELLGFTC